MHGQIKGNIYYADSEGHDKGRHDGEMNQNPEQQPNTEKDQHPANALKAQ